MAKKKKAIWGADSVKILCETCVEEINAGNRAPENTTLTRLGWKNVVVKFCARAKKDYDQRQIRNKWDLLRGDWVTWQSLMKETGLGFNYEKGIVEASEEWWKAKGDVSCY